MATIFRPMTRADIQRGLALCRAARWNQLSRDWELFLKLSPQGCRVAVHDDRVVGTVTTVRYENRFAWIGMVLVNPEMRGQGIGTQLLQQALTQLQDIPAIRLDATPAGHPVYRKLGFNDEYALSRMEMRAASSGELRRHTTARPMQKNDLPAIIAWDQQVFGADRHLTLEWMLAGAPEYAWVITQQSEIAGYMLGRHGFAFEHFGPIVARDQQLAQQLVVAGLQQQAHQPFVIDAPQHSTAWRAWLEAIGFHEQRPFIRMFYCANPFPGLPNNQFGILGPEFG